MKITSTGWYEGALMVDIRSELEQHPNIIQELGSYKGKFIRWCAKQRITYQADILGEFSEFKANYLEKRLYTKDLRIWKRISNKVFDRDNYTCQYCGQIGGILEVDHKLPISKGGTNNLKNLTTACRKCNRQKKDKTIEEFNAWRGIK